MIGILVHGDNHFIVQGPVPGREVALALAHHWSIIQIGASTPDSLSHWKIISKAFQEDLEWAVIVPGPDGQSPAVRKLLAGLSARGVSINPFH